MIEQTVKYILQSARSLIFGSRALNEAVEENRIWEVEKLLSQGIHADSTIVLNKYFQIFDTPLIRAARNGNAGIVRLLLEYHANPTATGSTGYTAFEIAMQLENYEVAKLLLSHENLANLRPEYDPRILLLAVDMENLTLIKSLIGRNIDLNEHAVITTKESIDAEYEKVKRHRRESCWRDEDCPGSCSFYERNAFEAIRVLEIVARRNNLELAHLLVKSGASVFSQFEICAENTEQKDGEMIISQYLAPNRKRFSYEFGLFKPVIQKYRETVGAQFLLYHAWSEIGNTLDSVTSKEFNIEPNHDVNQLIVSFTMLKPPRVNSQGISIENKTSKPQQSTCI